MTEHSSPRLLVMHCIRVRGAMDTAALVECTDLHLDEVSAELAALRRDDLVRYRPGRLSGFSLTGEGAAMLTKLLAAELDADDGRARMAALYDQFRPINARVLDLCTDWQMKAGNGVAAPNRHDDPDYDAAVIDRLVSAHNDALPLLASCSDVLARFASHRSRLTRALDHLVAGDTDYFTKPMFPSYHSVWFELHEDFLVTLGRSRLGDADS